MATLRDVARAAGVSHTTVSNAYHRPEKLSAAVRERVLEAARVLGYPGPNPLAAGLATRRVGTLGVLFTESLEYALTDPAAVLFLQGVAGTSELAEVGLTVIPAPPRRPPRTEEAAAAATDAVRRAVVDGILAYSLSDGHPGLLAARARGIPLVVVDEPEPGPADREPFIGLDDRDGARQAAAHLAGLGHRRFAILADRLGYDGWSGLVTPERLRAATFAVGRQRLAGYFDVLGADAGAPIIECDGNTPELGRAAAATLLDRPAADRPTAILAMTDQLARGVLTAAREAGLSVPADLSVVGFDDLPVAAETDPPLTTIRQPLVEKGRVAARMLLDLTADPESLIPRRTLPAELVVRGSTATPRPT